MAVSPGTLLIAIIALPFLGSCAAMLFRANARNAEAYLAGLVAVLGLSMVVAAYPGVVDGGALKYEAPWVPDLGLSFSLRMDGLAWVMAALITGIGVLVVLYARYYMSHRPTPYRASSPSCSPSWAQCSALFSRATSSSWSSSGN
jgi:multicomponent K+:H+ antiporter subunit A